MEGHPGYPYVHMICEEAESQQRNEESLYTFEEEEAKGQKGNGARKRKTRADDKLCTNEDLAKVWFVWASDTPEEEQK